MEQVVWKADNGMSGGRTAWATDGRTKCVIELLSDTVWLISSVTVTNTSDIRDELEENKLRKCIFSSVFYRSFFFRN
jgi:hypothetical protein